MKTFALAAAALGLAASATPALAGPEQGLSIKVPTRGLDLATAEGQAMLDRRIERAAKTVCRVDYARTGTRIGAHSSRECMNKALASAKRQVAAKIEEQRRGG